MADGTGFDHPSSVEPSWLHPETVREQALFRRVPLPDHLGDGFAGSTILLVEDDYDIRDLLVTLLKLAGFVPTACATAEQALQELREQHFDMVLTDYMLPNRSGGWLLQQAASEELIDDIPVLVLTAHPKPPDVDGYEIVQKPFDLDDLVDKVRQRLDDPARAARPGSPPRRPRSRRSVKGSDGDSPDPIELILYVNGGSPRSAEAIQAIEQALARYSSSRVKLTICERSPEAGAGAGTFVTEPRDPRLKGQRTFILGHITNPDILLELLKSCDGESS